MIIDLAPDLKRFGNRGMHLAAIDSDFHIDRSVDVIHSFFEVTQATLQFAHLLQPARREIMISTGKRLLYLYLFDEFECLTISTLLIEGIGQVKSPFDIVGMGRSEDGCRNGARL